MYVLDSSVLIELIAGTERIRPVRALCGDEPAATTTLCIHEVLAGAKTEQQRLRFGDIFSRLIILHHDENAVRLGASIERSLSLQGKPIGRTDCMIAGICQANAAELVTFDKDFLAIESLKSHVF